MIYEVTLFGSSSLALKESKFRDNCIVAFNVKFSTGDLSLTSKGQCLLPEKIYGDGNRLNFVNCVNILRQAIQENAKIRIWSSRLDVNYYLLIFFIVSLLPKNYRNVYVIYSDEYLKDCYSPGTMTPQELENAVVFEHQLSENEIKYFSDEWRKICVNQADVRIMEDFKVKQVSFDYFDSIILEKISMLGNISIVYLITELMQNIHIDEMIWFFLIQRLINKKKIKIIEKREREIKNIVSIS